jgi:hypothetical protein
MDILDRMCHWGDRHPLTGIIFCSLAAVTLVCLILWGLVSLGVVQ